MFIDRVFKSEVGYLASETFKEANAGVLKGVYA